MVPEQPESPPNAYRHASNLELFLDLVFVFCVTQVTSFVADHLTVGGVGKGALLGFLIWWQWTAFTWAGTAIDFQADGRARLVVLAMVPATLIMAISVPAALDGQGLWFSGAYFVVQSFVLAMQGLQSWSNPADRGSWLRYAPLAALAPGVLVLGGLLHGNARLITFIAVAALMIASALVAAGADTQWNIDPTHFAERHALFVIITLGEVVVAIGATAAAASSEHGLTVAALLSVVATTAVAAVLWWSYFGFVPAVIELALHRATPQQRGTLARDVGSFGHFPLVFGLILFAIAAKHVVAHPQAHLAEADRWVLLAAVLLFIGGQLFMQVRLVRRVAPERLVALAVVVGLTFAAPALAGTAVVGLIAGVLATMSVITWRRFQGTDLSRAAEG